METTTGFPAALAAFTGAESAESTETASNEEADK